MCIYYKDKDLINNFGPNSLYIVNEFMYKEFRILITTFSLILTNPV